MFDLVMLSNGEVHRIDELEPYRMTEEDLRDMYNEYMYQIEDELQF